jgi:hypothetical protein
MTHLIPLLTRIWPLPDDLPHAAGMGELARVKRWFDESGAPALGDLDNHYPCNSPHARKYDDLHWGPPDAQHVVDTALAWSVINRHFDVARTSSSSTAQTSTPIGTRTSRRASCTPWSSTKTTSRCDSSSTAAST